MNRRGFLGRVLGGIATAALAPWIGQPIPPLQIETADLPIRARKVILPVPQIHPKAFELVMPSTAEVAQFAKVNEKIEMRFVRQYDIKTDSFPCRLDVLYGVACLQPNLAVRIAS